MPEVLDIKLIHETKRGSLIKSPAKIAITDGRIEFLKSPFALKDEIKAMAGSRWHGFDDDPRKIWSVKDCFRNRFQLGYLMGEPVYEWFDRDLIRHTYRDYFLNGKPVSPMPHQFDMADSGLTYHYQIWAAEMGVGKTLSAQMVIEHSNTDYWFWVGPARSLPNMEREFRLWGFNGSKRIEFMSYERLVRTMDEWATEEVPQGVIFDECYRLKTWTSQRTKAAVKLADLIREKYKMEGFVIGMSGTPSAHKPTDWWAQCEIAWAGFLREGSPKALEQRLAFMQQKAFDTGTFWQNIGWRDDERKCEVCGEYEDDECHELEAPNFHRFKPSKNEVSYMFERLNGLVVIKHKKDCLTLPDKRYRVVSCKPTASVLRVAKALVDSASNAMTGMTLLRELSDGFQYRDVIDGVTKCDYCTGGEIDEWFIGDKSYQNIDMMDPEQVAKLEKRKVACPKCDGSGEMPRVVRVTKEVPCPKEDALRELLDENDETGRLVIFAGFTGSVDRCVGVCHKEGWDVVRCDGRGYQVTKPDGSAVVCEPLDYWADMGNRHVAFVANPESGGMSLTLVEARMAVYWSNSFKPDSRSQSEDRIHRKGMDENLGCTIVDLIHLPTDERVLSLLREERKLELMTLGEITNGVEWES